MSWDPNIYLKFGGERTRAAADLVARIPLDAPARIVDLGCGPGNSTAMLRARYPNGDILGVDSSEEMIAKARVSDVNARFEIAGFESWSPAQAPDLIYANAAFHWAADPLSLVQRLFAALAPRGALAFQVPQNFDRPSHLEMNAVAADGPWAEKLKGAQRGVHIHGADCARALAGRAAGLDIWSTEYLHILQGEDAVFNWISGSAIRPLMDALQGAERDGFAAAVKARLRRAYPAEADGRTFFPFRRLFVIALKP
ncbi:MAG: methyltransferase domain-containing protein [Hyphomonadaceae bacterium]|nr:methyltransferase domain-containing protein [Hyphomonadaceae bacterium]